MREFERFDEKTKIWEKIVMTGLVKGDFFRIRDDENLVKDNGVAEFIAIGSAYKNEDGIFQIDYIPK